MPRRPYAILLFNGRGVTRDPDQAVRLLETASGKGNLEAMSQLGALFVEGRAATEERRRGPAPPQRGGRRRVRSGDGQHRHHVQSGRRRPAIFAKAAMWYKRAADLGNASV